MGTPVHPRQTQYFVLAKPPEVGNITYQVDERAVAFLTEVREYMDGDELPWSIVYPLRQIRDLYTLDEGRPRTAAPEEFETTEVTLPTLSDDGVDDLAAYLRDHPDVTGDFETFEARIRKRDPTYIESITRNAYTPSTSPGHDQSGNDSLDRIAETYFGDGSADYIEWNGERVYEYVEVVDRAGDRHQFPRIEKRLPEGERYRLSQQLYERWGADIGASDVNSRRYEPGEDGFPNRWIGQREDAPEPSLERAESPRAFFYRTLAGRSHYAPGTEAKAAFEATCAYSLEVYNANFPTAVDPTDFSVEYVTVDEATEPWHDFQVPPAWSERYADTGGLPPLKSEQGIQSLDADRQRIAVEHGPSGDGYQWFDSVETAVDFLEHEAYARLLIALYEHEVPVRDFGINGAAAPEITAHVDGQEMFVELIGETSWRITIESTVAGTHVVLSEGSNIVEWERPAVDAEADTHSVLAEQAQWFDTIADFLTAVTEF